VWFVFGERFTLSWPRDSLPWILILLLLNCFTDLQPLTSTFTLKKLHSIAHWVLPRVCDLFKNAYSTDHQLTFPWNFLSSSPLHWRNSIYWRSRLRIKLRDPFLAMNCVHVDIVGEKFKAYKITTRPYTLYIVSPSWERFTMRSHTSIHYWSRDLEAYLLMNTALISLIHSHASHKKSSLRVY